MVTIEDLTCLKMAELTRTLAGCAIFEPQAVVKLLDRIDPSDLLDDRAAAFLARLRKMELNEGDEGYTLAIQWGFLTDCLTWIQEAIAQPIMTIDLAERALRDLQGLAITRKYVTRLQKFGAEIKAAYGPR